MLTGPELQGACYIIDSLVSCASSVDMTQIEPIALEAASFNQDIYEGYLYLWGKQLQKTRDWQSVLLAPRVAKLALIRQFPPT